MPQFSEFYDTVDDIVQHLRMDLIGPVEKEEVLETMDLLSWYPIGILWSQSKHKETPPIEVTSQLEELFEEELENKEEPKQENIFRPSSMGISFVIPRSGVLQITFSYAVYHHIEQAKGQESKRHFYQREARKFSSQISVPDRIFHKEITKKEADISVYLAVRRIYSDGSRLVTVSVWNKHQSKAEFIESSTNALFQCHLSIRSKNGFLPVYQKRNRQSFAEEVSDMLYSDTDSYSYGHGCSSVHIEQNGIVKEIASAFIPAYRMRQMMPRLLQNADYLNMQYWKTANRKDACRQLNGFIQQYQQWLEDLKHHAKQIAAYPEPAQRSFAEITLCIQRLQTGVDVLRQNDCAWKSFQYMNEAMLLQRVKTKHCKPESVRWYPFQLAYILQILPDLVDSNSAFHKDVDLLWFPTGGGKTEAYLGLSAFAIFYRRLQSGTDIDGVTIIMRYTLRLLTIQQFERAMALVCACEYLRQIYAIPGEEISIGLWIGSGMTPNHIQNAKETLHELQNNNTVLLYKANPMQVTKCPWCGTEIGLNGYEIIQESMNISCCNNPDCPFHSHLPIYVVDDDIYQRAPTFILSTVDKFARITWEEKAGNLFGANGCKPPELIIQDELHLISGPLGSITGIYEVAIEQICQHYGGTPKIIASTATVKNADQQIRILYNRKMHQFPPNGLSQKDSFFAIEAEESKRPARTYVGLCSSGSGTSELLIRIFALLTYLKRLYQKQKKPTAVIDQFYTYVGYFNTLKELGSNSIIISDRIISEVKYLISSKFKTESEKNHLTVKDILPQFHSYLMTEELTSRNSASEIKKILNQLENPCTNENCFDYIMASNMLSVGIDISRLGVMCVYGQPKSNAEYIQATSRVGRSNPGLVVALYNGMRSRDKSYYEQFTYYHSTFYKYVESASVTSYSPRAIEKALHCAMMAIIRQTIPKYNPNDGARLYTGMDSEVEAVKQEILQRVREVAAPNMAQYAEQWLDYYLEVWREQVAKNPDRLVFSDYQNEKLALFRSGENQMDTDIPSILNSVRNVETEAGIYFTSR